VRTARDPGAVALAGEQCLAPDTVDETLVEADEGVRGDARTEVARRGARLSGDQIGQRRPVFREGLLLARLQRRALRDHAVDCEQALERVRMRSKADRHR
jgi:hypothetical protein